MRHLGVLLAIVALLVSPVGAAQQAAATGMLWDRVAARAARLEPNALPPKALQKIDPELYRQLLSLEEIAGAHLRGHAGTDRWVTYLVHLADDAPLAGPELPRGRDARRHAIVQRLRARAERSQGRALATLREALGTGRAAGYRSYWIANVLVVEGGLEAAVALALLPEVVAIEPNRTIQMSLPEVAAVSQTAPSVAWGVDAIDADRVWRELGITGRGIVVANMDSGVDWMHPDLQPKYRGYNPDNPMGSNHNYNWFDFTGTYPDAPGPSRPIHRAYLPLLAGGQVTSTFVTGPPNGVSSYPHWQIKDHGTHVMGTMVGSSPDGSTIVGVAPGAQWIAVKVFDDRGIARDADILAGFQWLLAPTDLQGNNPDPSKAPDVVCNSWGDSRGEGRDDPWGSIAVYAGMVSLLRAAGIAMVFSAGNHGPTPGTIDAPASYTNTLAIGATAAGDAIWDRSSRGPSPWWQLKPDVTAPGVSVLSTIPGGRHDTLSGTSMAAPHAAGAIALMLEADRRVFGVPTMTITTTERILRETAVDLGEPGPDNDYGYGRIDAYAAVRAVSDLQRLILPMEFRQATMAAP